MSRAPSSIRASCPGSHPEAPRSGTYRTQAASAAPAGATLRAGWIAEAETPWGDLLAHARDALRRSLQAEPGTPRDGAELEREAETLLARTLHHGGLALAGRPLDPSAPPPARVEAGTRVTVHALRAEPEPVPLPADAVQQDEPELGLLAVAKPPGMPTQRTRASARLDLEHVLRSRLEIPGLRAVHRLDRDTSGLVLLARDAESAARLGRALRSQGLERRYLAWVEPAPDRDRFRVAGWLGRVPDPARFRFALRAPQPGRHPFRRARWSATRFRVLHRGPGRALVLAEPETGRTHQIRAHLAAAGSPVLGDDLYGAGGTGRALLHALALQLRPPGRAEALALCAAPPPDFPVPEFPERRRLLASGAASPAP